MEDEKSLWNKTTDEFTFGDNMKIAAAVTAITVAVPVACIAVVSVYIKIVDKYIKKAPLAPVAYIDGNVVE